MKLPRRNFLQLVASAAALPAVPCLAKAHAYPTRSVRWIVPMAAGNPPDIVARLIAQWLSERLGQPFVIENRPGAGGTIAAEAVARAPADGHTLLTMAPSSAINATLFAPLYEKLNFNVVRDIAPVATFTRQAQVMVANPSLPAKTVPEFIAYAKANPAKISMASNGTGTGQHVAGELFKMMTGVDMVHVPYRGGASAMADLIAGRVQVMFTSPFGLIEYIRAGKLRALAVTTATRSEALPDVPPVGDFVPGYEVIAWFGVGAPMNTPAGTRLDTLGVTVEKPHADSLFQFRDRSGDGGLRGVEERGRLLHAARLHNGHQDVEVLQLDPASDAIAQLHSGPDCKN